MPSLDSLSDPDAFLNDLTALSSKGTYCFVGHEPHLSQSISFIMGSEDSKVNLEKSGVAILEGDDISLMKLTTLVSPKLVLKI